LRPEIRAFLDSDQQINSVFSHPVVRSSVGKRVENSLHVLKLTISFANQQSGAVRIQAD
jgi:hypothetical protein